MLNGSHQELLDVERVKTLYANTRIAVIGVFVGALAFTLFHRNNLDSVLLSAWATAIVVINLPRLLMVEGALRRLRDEAVTRENVLLCERKLYFGLLLSSLSWSVISFFPYQGDIVLIMMFNASLLVAMSSAGIVNHMTSMKMGLTYLNAALLPLIARAAWEGGETLYILAAAACAYYVVFARMAYRMHLAVVDTISLKLENEGLSLKDVLTGLWNRRELYLFVEQLLPSLERKDEIFSIILIDLDHFKQYNDTQGHNAGDALLKDVADIIRHESREEDLAVRYGGEEFMVVLPRADAEQAHQVAERIRLSVKAKTEVSLSAGIAEYEAGLDFDEMTRRADKALYRAKSEGRNRVVQAWRTALDMAF